MSDQCRNCTSRGDINLCENTPCNKHDDWIVDTLRNQLAEAQARIKELEEENSNYADQVDAAVEDYNNALKQISDLQSRLDARGEAYRFDYDEEMDRYYIATTSPLGNPD